MKIAFKVISIILLVIYGIAAIAAILAIMGAGAATAGKTGGEAAVGGLAILYLLLALVPTVIAIFMAIYGIKENYNMCFKLSAILMVLSLISFFASDSKGSNIIGLLFAIGYCVMAKMLDTKSY